jgi:hypothetical protein
MMALCFAGNADWLHLLMQRQENAVAAAADTLWLLTAKPAEVLVRVVACRQCPALPAGATGRCNQCGRYVCIHHWVSGYMDITDDLEFTKFSARSASGA